MNPDQQHLAPDDVARRWPAECAIDFDDDAQPGEGGFIAILAVALFALIAAGALVAAIY
jgi:hypothetical protein